MVQNCLPGQLQLHGFTHATAESLIEAKSPRVRPKQTAQGWLGHHSCCKRGHHAERRKRAYHLMVASWLQTLIHSWGMNRCLNWVCQRTRRKGNIWLCCQGLSRCEVMCGATGKKICNRQSDITKLTSYNLFCRLSIWPIWLSQQADLQAGKFACKCAIRFGCQTNFGNLLWPSASGGIAEQSHHRTNFMLWCVHPFSFCLITMRITVQEFCCYSLVPGTATAILVDVFAVYWTLTNWMTRLGHRYTTVKR